PGFEKCYIKKAYIVVLSNIKVFSSGDYISGRVTLELVNDCKIDSLCVKLKGKAEVKWTEHYGKTVPHYVTLLFCFSGNNTVGPGCHVYPFTFQIPDQELPSSFKGSNGKILYTLEANLSRSMRLDCKAKAEFTVVHKANLKSDPLLMTPQHSFTDKKMKLFTSGTVGMDVNIERTGFHQGEGIKVVASIQNKSSRDIKPKYCLYRKYSYFAKGKRKVETKDILKEVGEVIPPSADQTVTRIITIPSTTCVSILNCNIIKAEYRLRKLPLVHWSTTLHNWASSTSKASCDEIVVCMSLFIKGHLSPVVTGGMIKLQPDIHVYPFP
uniref:Arrestin C-terminal-like domain-containing protein n=1 Tax=Lates calcarifer TaxID=8187 RepID=A0A4W6G826_LATCA